MAKAASLTTIIGDFVSSAFTGRGNRCTKKQSHHKIGNSKVTTPIINSEISGIILSTFQHLV